MKNWFVSDGKVSWRKIAAGIFSIGIIATISIVWIKLGDVEKLSKGNPPPPIAGQPPKKGNDAPFPPGSDGPSELLDSEETPQSDAPKKEKGNRPPSLSEMPFAEWVEGEPLSVTLPHHPEIGEISIEQYGADGKPSGLPLPGGTPVSIPDPNRPGKAILFRVPMDAL